VINQQVKQVNASRFRLARARRGLTKVELARRAEMSTRALFDIESGLTKPTDETISTLADRLRFPERFFFRGDVVTPTPEAASFRSLRSMSATIRDSALAAGAIAFELSEWIERRFELTKPALPDLQGFEPEAAAHALRAHWKIGERPIGNMIHFLESIGVRVFSLVEDRRVDAFSLWHGETPFVFLNTMKSAEHSRMDAAHELGHLVLHRHGIPWGRNIEREAQLFAAAFLMPRATMLTMPKISMPTLQHLIQLKKPWGVSAAALAHRLHELNLVTDWGYRGLCIDLAKFGRTREPDGVARESSDVMAKVFGEMASPGESKADAARDLDLYQTDLEALIFGLRSEPSTASAKPARARSGKPAGHLRDVSKKHSA
jgi:Zn-dependent peptidase ImmA (M78 family)/DNA-binding XRE family transcriptional regulator